MSTPTHLEVVREAEQGPPVQSAVLGMLLFLMVEAMMFAGFISAFMIVKSNAIEWPPPGQPRLPVERTLLNSVALLVSGGVLLHAGRVFRRNRLKALGPMGVAMALGAFFVAFQGWEWLQLLREGLTLTSSQHGSFFYVIVGMHAAHALVALAALAWAWRKLSTLELAPSTLAGVSLFWYFVVLLWPVLYWRVYL